MPDNVSVGHAVEDAMAVLRMAYPPLYVLSAAKVGCRGRNVVGGSPC
jgi:hypothetical protein